MCLCVDCAMDTQSADADREGSPVCSLERCVPVLCINVCLPLVLHVCTTEGELRHSAVHISLSLANFCLIIVTFDFNLCCPKGKKWVMMFAHLCVLVSKILH